MGEDLPQRKSLRLKGYDYGASGYYFVTLCTKARACLFWQNPVGADSIRPSPLLLTPLGQTVDTAIQEIPNHYPGVRVDKYVIMPNHVHMILALGPGGGRMLSAPTKSLSTVVGQMKRASSRAAGAPLWQRSFHDHIIRSQADYLLIWKYVDDNPAKWREDRYFPQSPSQ